MAKNTRPMSKAAQETARLKAERAERAKAMRPSTPPIEGLPPAEQPRSGGLLTRMRGGFISVTGQGGKSKKNKILDIALWVAVIVAAALFFARRM